MRPSTTSSPWLDRPSFGVVPARFPSHRFKNLARSDLPVDCRPRCAADDWSHCGMLADGLVARWLRKAQGVPRSGLRQPPNP